jgi:hypothetical protein
MRIFLLMLLIIGYKLAQATPQVSDSSMVQTNSDSLARADSIHGVVIKQRGEIYQQNYGKIYISVFPPEASDADLTVIQNKILYYKPGMEMNSDLPIPDTIGIWKAPLSILLYEGDYDVISRKDGFRTEIQRLSLRRNLSDKMSIDMKSLPYLQSKRKQWNTVKWISAGIAIGAGIASYYIHTKIVTFKNEYNNAVSLSVIQDKRNKINQSQGYYQISSVVSFTALGGFGLSWFIEGAYE